MERKGYCVYGEWRQSKTDRWMPVTDSSTGEVIAEVPCCTKDEVEDAIASAAAAFPEWSMLSISKRTQMMFKWRNVLMEHLDELTYLCAKELGKTLNEARGDVLKAIEPTELAFGAAIIARLNVLGRLINIISYDDTYTDDEGTDHQYITAGNCVLTCPGAGRTLYGAVTQLEQSDHVFHTYTGMRVPKYVGNVEADQRKLTLTSRPMMVPNNKNPFIVAKVLGE